MVDALLTFAHAGARPSPCERADVRAVLDEMRPAADAAGVVLSVESPQDLVVACSPAMLAVVVCVPVPRCPSEIAMDTRPNLMLAAPPTQR